MTSVQQKPVPISDPTPAFHPSLPHAEHPHPEIPVSLKFLLKRGLVALLVVVLTFLAVECVARLIVGLAVPVQSLDKTMDAKYYLAKRPMAEDKPKVLVSGDSLAEFAVYPELMASELKDKGYDVDVRNLASIGNTAERAIFLLKTSIDAGNRPDVVVYDLNPRLFNKAFLAADNDPGEAGNLFAKSYVGSCVYPKAGGMAKLDCLLKKNSYLYRYRSFLKDELAALPETLSKPAQRLKLDFEDRPETEISKAGWMPAYKVFTKGEFYREYSKPQYNSQFLEHFDRFEWTDETLMQMAAFCKKENIPLILVWLPEHELMNRYYSHYHLSQEYFHVRFKALSKKLNLPLLDMRNAVRDAGEFYDPDHVNSIGSINLSRQLANRLVRNSDFLKAVAVGKREQDKR